MQDVAAEQVGAQWVGSTRSLRGCQHVDFRRGMRPERGCDHSEHEKPPDQQRSSDAEPLLNQTLEEEKEADKLLTEIAEADINRKAA